MDWSNTISQYKSIVCDSSFWAYGMQASLAMQELLNKPDLEIEELLDEDGLQVEIKTNNQKLLDL